MNKIRIDPLAQRELADGADYYADKGAGLGHAFLLEAGRAFLQLSEVPLASPIVRGRIRRRPLFRFPYSIFYRVVGTEVQIIAVVHQRRDPKYIASRLRGKNRAPKHGCTRTPELTRFALFASAPRRR